MIGNNAKTGIADDMPQMKMAFVPQRLWMREKKHAVKSPFRMPHVARSLPIVEGGQPKPPRSIGVDRKSGCMAR